MSRKKNEEGEREREREREHGKYFEMRGKLKSNHNPSITQSPKGREISNK